MWWSRIIIKNLLLGYFHTPPSKRHEALQVIGQVLSYSRDELQEVCLTTCYFCSAVNTFYQLNSFAVSNNPIRLITNGTVCCQANVLPLDISTC